MTTDRSVKLRPISWRDLPFLCISGLDRERIGVQYDAKDYWQQFKIAPLRFFRRESREMSFIIWVDGRRGGFVGINPMSRNIEYYLQPWARGGVGTVAVREFLTRSLPFDEERSAFMIGTNTRSQATLRNVLVSLGLVAGVDYEEYEINNYRGFTIRVGAKPNSPD